MVFSGLTHSVEQVDTSTVTEPTVHPDSQSVVILPFLYPPRRSACRFICDSVCRVVPARVSPFPVGSSVERALRGGLVCEAPRVSRTSSVARVCRLTPLQDF